MLLVAVHLRRRIVSRILTYAGPTPFWTQRALSASHLTGLPPPVIMAIRFKMSSRGSSHHSKRNGPRAVLGSQQPPTRMDVQIGFTLLVLSDALRAEDGSRSGGGVKMLPFGDLTCEPL